MIPSADHFVTTEALALRRARQAIKGELPAVRQGVNPRPDRPVRSACGFLSVEDEAADAGRGDQ